MACAYTLPNGFEKVRPSRGALATCWVVDLVLAAAFAVPTVIMVGLVMEPYNVTADNGVIGPVRHGWRPSRSWPEPSSLSPA